MENVFKGKVDNYYCVHLDSLDFNNENKLNFY